MDRAFDVTGEVRSFELVIPDCPKSMNNGGGGSRSHHMAAYREKRRWEDRYEFELLDMKVPKGMLFCSVMVVVRWKERRRRDVSNYYASVLKPLYDVLTRGWLPDDTAEFVELAGFRFEIPEVWSYRDPRLKVQLAVRLEARYPERSRK